jgi:hypothetical protein
MQTLIRAGLVLILLTAAHVPLTAGSTGDPQALPFIDDDYDRALAEARARDLPLFIETWAPW